MNPKKKKHRPPIHGSTKMARLAGMVKASKAAIAARSQKKSPLASESNADAEIVTSVTEEVPISEFEASSGSAAQLTSDSAAPPCVVDSDPSAVKEGITLVAEGDETTAALIHPKPAIEEGITRSNGEGKRTAGLPETRPVQNYASLLKVSAQLEEIGTPTEHVSGAPFVLIPDENIEAAKEEFKDFIYARFHGEFPSMGRIIGVVNAIWGKTGPRIFVHNIGDGCYLLRVNSLKTKEWMLSRTCWNIAGYPMFVAPWSPDFMPEEAPITSVVVPIELRGVPYLLFNRESLSRLATAVGKPVSLAPETERKENFEVAKLYVRVDITKKLPTKIISGFSSGRENEISVSYPWLPVKCPTCGKHGHSAEKCRFGKKEDQTHRARARSTSVDKGRNRLRSDKDRGRDMGKKTLPPQKQEEREELEEGEIVMSKSSKDSQEVRSIDPGDTGLNATEGRSVSEYRTHPSAVSQKDEQPVAKASEQTGSGSRTAEAPFFLVHGRKSGRRAAKSH